jgi:hypothetical protein
MGTPPEFRLSPFFLIDQNVRFSIKARSHVDFANWTEDSRQLNLNDLNQVVPPMSQVELTLAYIDPNSQLDNQGLRDFYMSLPSRTTRPNAQEEVPKNLLYLGSFGSQKTTYQDLVKALRQDGIVLNEDAYLLIHITKRPT